MSLELNYNFRHLLARRLSAFLTLGGIALVVSVYMASLMLSEGLKATLGGTGLVENVMITRTGANNEVQSGINRDHAAILATQPEVAINAEGRPLITYDVAILVSLRRKEDGLPSNVTVRGVSEGVGSIRPFIKVIEGRWPSAGSREIIVPKGIRGRFNNTDIGQTIRLVGSEWQVVGVFDAGETGFGSEIWADSETLIGATRRDRFSSVTFRLADGANFEELRNRIESDPRLTLTVKTERQFFEDLSGPLSSFMRLLGTFVSIIFAIGAVIGAMITMYSEVANRIREIGVLRALGFGKFMILRAFLAESILLSFMGGLLGLVFAFLISFVRVSTINFTTFSEVGFQLTLTPGVALHGLTFAVIMGTIGGILPAFKAGRMKIVEALRVA
jgi:ABC-type antimicrobial peptide transport system permease subunit